MNKDLIPTNYKFRPEFEAKLKRLRVKHRFIRAINTCDREYMGMKIMTPIEIAKELNSSNNWCTFIVKAFNWSNTVENYNFWYKIAIS